MEQGRALETLGHAVEYLIDSRMFLLQSVDERSEREAVQILMRQSRAIFAECAEVISLRQRLNRWVASHVGGAAERKKGG